ncbi:MAG: VanZ family protein [Bacteroidales bacterium]
MKFRYLLPSILWSVIIFFIIAIRGSRIPDSALFYIPHFDKLLHAGIFFVLSILLLWGLLKQEKNKIPVPYIITIVLCVIYGVATEFLQHFYVDGRSGEIADFAANTIGSLIGIAGFYYVKKSHYLPKFFS